MSYIETILITHQLENIELHNKRMNWTRKYFYDLEPVDLRDYIEIKKNSRCRVIYDKEIKKIEYFPLKKREFNSFKVVECNDIEYKFKSEDREKLNSLKVEGYDEVIIVKNGFITDTTISNLAFFDGNKWITPKTPLLKGTKREELIQKGFLKEKEIKIEDIKNFKKFAMMNAIIGFYEINIDTILI